MSELHKNLVADFGGKGDGLSDDGEAFQRALNSGTARLQIPAGRYLIGRPLHVRSGTILEADPQAEMILADGVAKSEQDHLLSSADLENGTENISISGGIWNGNNAGNARPTGLFDPGCSGALFHFRKARNLRLQNLHLRNAEAYYARFTEVSKFHIESIRFSSDKIRHNNDGIHLGGNCQDGVILDIKGLHPGVTGDDMIALNADDALNRTEVRGMTCGPIRNILIKDIEAEGCHSFVRLLSVYSTIENVIIQKVRGTCEIAALNCDGARGCRVPVFDEKNPPYPDGVGLLKNIDASDFIVAKSVKNGIPLLRMETRMENFLLKNFIRRLDLDQDGLSPTLGLRHVSAREILLNNGQPSSLQFGDSFNTNETDIRELRINARDRSQPAPA